MPIGLDVGGRDAVVARDGPSGVDTSSERTVYVELPDDDMVLDMLSSADAEYRERDGRLYVVGDAAADFANMFNARTEPLCPTGTIAGDREGSGDLAELLVAELAGAADPTDDPAAYAVPPDPVDGGGDTLYHRRTLEDRLEALGYDPAPVARSVAAGYAALDDESYTGLVVVLGDATTDVCLLDGGVPVSRVGLSRGGRWIDQQVAEATDRSIDDVAAERDAFDLSAAGDDGIDGVLEVYYRNLLSYVAEQLSRRLDGDARPAGGPVPVVVAGDAAVPTGIAEALDEALADADLPVTLGDVELADDPRTAAARGALVAAGTGDGADAPERAVPDTAFEPALATMDGESASTGAAPSETLGGQSRDADDETPAADAGSERAATSSATASSAQTGQRDAAGDRVDVAADDQVDVAADDQVDVAALERRVDECTQDVAALRESVAAAATADDLDALRASVTAVEERLDDVAARVEQLSGVESRVEAAESRIEDVEGVRDRVEGVDEQIEAVTERVESVDAQVEDVDGRIEVVDTQVENVDDRVEDVGERIDAVDARVADVSDRIESVEAVRDRVESVSEQTDSVSERVETVAGRLDDVRERTREVDTVHEDLEAVRDDLDAATADIDAVTADLDAVRESVDAHADLATDVESVESDLSALEPRVESAASVETVADLWDSVEAVESDVDDVATALADRPDDPAASADLSALADRVDALPDGDAVEALRTDVASLQERVATVEALDERVADLENLDERVADLESHDVQSLRADVESLTAQVEDVRGLDERVDALDGSIEDVQTQFATLQQTVDDLREAVSSVDDDLAAVRDLASTAVDGEDPHSEDEVRAIAAQEARSAVLAPVAAGGGGAGLVGAAVAALLNSVVVAVPLVALAFVCLAVAWRAW
jgi:DNA repair ATPase RecN